MSKFAVSLASALICSLLICSSCNTPVVKESEKKETEIKADTAHKDTVAAKAYVCPMGPQCGQGDSAAKCPSCGMDMKANPEFKKK
jgi:hypothetical protein